MEDPLEAAKAVGAECVQLFVGPPQSFKKPPPLAAAEEPASDDLPVYVHAPTSSTWRPPTNRIRIPSRKILKDTLDRASEIDADRGHRPRGSCRGRSQLAVVHGWRKVFEELESDIPIYIENTAGGNNAMTLATST